MDLELLGKIAVELSVHSHPAVKKSFEKLVESVGTKRFPEDYCALQKFLMKLHHQVQLTTEFSYFQNGAPSFTWQTLTGPAAAAVSTASANQDLKGKSESILEGACVCVCIISCPPPLYLIFIISPRSE